MYRNQVIPLEINTKSSLDSIAEELEKYLKNPQNNDISLEIEGKVGYFELLKESQRETMKLLEQISQNNIVLVDEVSIEKRFVSEVEENQFEKLVDYFKRAYDFAKYKFSNTNKISNNGHSDANKFLLQFYEMMNRPVSETLSVDYIMQGTKNKKLRMSYDLGQGVSFIEKTNKKHLNLLHNSNNFPFFLFNEVLEIPFRLSINTEQVKKAEDFVNFHDDSCQIIRIKNRTIFPYQFFEFHFTKVLSLTKSHSFFNYLIKKQKLQNSQNDPKFDLEVLSFFTKQHEFSYEIEVEIKDLNFLVAHVDKPEEFKKIILRLFRNIETLYEKDTCSLDEPFYTSFFGKRVPKPVFGDYMMKELIKKEKNNNSL